MPAKIWRRIPAATAFVLLAWQMAIPWMAPHFVTGDGPSHLYGATILRELLFHHRHSIYSSIYTIQRKVLPNWTTTIALALTGAVAGTDHAEALFASLAILTGFLGLCYLSRALAPEESPWTPLMNFLVQSWFLWAGFYNFYLGMVLLPFVIAYYIRNAGKMTWNRTATLAAGFTVLFFTHLIAVALALVAVGAIAVWVNVRNRAAFSELGRLLIAAAPALILSGIFLHRAEGGAVNAGDPVGSLIRGFPQQIFLTGFGAWGKQTYLWPLALAYIAAGTLLMKKREWASARGGLVIAALLAFVGYLFVPDEGLGGSVVKIRFAWAVFMLAVPVAASVSRLRVIRTMLALVVSILLGGNLVETAIAGRSLSHAIDSYLTTTSRIPPNATLTRLFYPAPDAPARYGYQGVARNPFFHLDALVAVRQHELDLTDYEPLTRLFPVVHKKAFTGQEYQLWGFEGPGPDAVSLLTWVRQVFPRPIDYVLLFGHEETAEAGKAHMAEMTAYLNSTMRLVAASTDGYLHIYARN